MASSLLRRSKKEDQTSQDASILRLAAVTEARADSLLASGNRAGALEAAIKSAELYLKARNQCTNEIERVSLGRKCQELMGKAERWKKRLKQQQEEDAADQQRPTQAVYAAGSPKKYPGPKPIKKLTKKEEMVILKSSKINGNVFPPWKESPLSSEFPQEPFLDPAGFLGLSESQTTILDDWMRPREIFGDEARISGDVNQLDLTQDVITDCSVVASLCAGTRREGRGFGETVTNIIYPQDEKGQIVSSDSGKYIVKLFFNGCYRKVIIDHYLPKANIDRVLFVSCRKTPSVYAYALIEKAYLKVMGGYDFPGSNSGTDLLVLTGWIPEHIFLQSDDIIFSALWKRMRKPWATGDILITLGTGKMTKLEEFEFGLIGEHDYVVLELKEEGGERFMLVKNPWSEGTVWRDLPQEDSGDEKDFDADTDLEDEVKENPWKRSSGPSSLQPGAFWISFENVCRNFANLYLNWNPSLFTHVYETHFTWDLETKISESSFGGNPQYFISNPSSSPATLWIMLSRHLGLPNESGEGMTKSGYIALYLFDSNGNRVYLPKPNLYCTTYVDSPQTLLRLDNLPAKATYTLVVSSQELSIGVHHFSIFIYSLSLLNIDVAKEPYPYSVTITSSWTSSTSGGNANSPSYPRNPQFRLTLPTAASSIALLLESPSAHPVHVKLVHSLGKRVSAVTAKDIITESGEYKRSTALATTGGLLAGNYTVVASTFEAGQLADFRLTLLSTSSDATFNELHGETAGCFETLLRGIWAEGKTRMVFPVEVERLIKVWAKARTVRYHSHSPALRVGIKRKFARGLDEDERTIARSHGGYKDLPMGVRTEPVDLEAGNGGYLVVLERLGGGDAGWEVVVVSEGNIWVGEEDEIDGDDDKEGGDSGDED